MTSANDEVPEPPRHCMEDMDLVGPVDGVTMRARPFLTRGHRCRPVVRGAAATVSFPQPVDKAGESDSDVTSATSRPPGVRQGRSPGEMPANNGSWRAASQRRTTECDGEPPRPWSPRRGVRQRYWVAVTMPPQMAASPRPR